MSVNRKQWHDVILCNIHAGSSGTSASVSSPRLLAVLEEGSSLELVEEFTPADSTSGDSRYVANSVAEIVLGHHASLKHG